MVKMQCNHFEWDKGGLNRLIQFIKCNNPAQFVFKKTEKLKFYERQHRIGRTGLNLDRGDYEIRCKIHGVEQLRDPDYFSILTLDEYTVLEILES